MTILKHSGSALSIIASVLLISVTNTFAEDHYPRDARVHRGFAIAPVPLDLKGKNKNLVGLGSYLVNAAGGCNDCHTNPSYAEGGNPFKGEPTQINTDYYLAGGMAFGPVISKNITPNAEGLPAGLTLDEFVSLMRTGHDPDNPTKILQVMPWPIYKNMIVRDLIAVYEYLKAIPPLPDNLAGE